MTTLSITLDLILTRDQENDHVVLEEKCLAQLGPVLKIAELLRFDVHLRGISEMVVEDHLSINYDIRQYNYEVTLTKTVKKQQSIVHLVQIFQGLSRLAEYGPPVHHIDFHFSF